MKQEIIKNLNAVYFDNLVLRVNQIIRMHSEKDDYTTYLGYVKARDEVLRITTNVSEILYNMPVDLVPSFIHKLKEELEVKQPVTKMITRELIESYSKFLKPYIDYIKSLSIDNYLQIRPLMQMNDIPNMDAVTPTPPPRAKLIWKGQANVLYDLFAQCLTPPSGKPYINNSKTEVAEFIAANFEGIKASVNTIANQLGKIGNNESNRPTASKRTNIKQNKTKG